VSATSRFQLDINRRKQDAIYLRPEQAWGLQVWKKSLPKKWVDRLYTTYDDIFQSIDTAIQETIDKYGYFVVYDIHSYNAKREGAHTPIDQLHNPQINIGTVHNHSEWSVLTSLFIEALERKQAGVATFDVRENINFKG